MPNILVYSPLGRAGKSTLAYNFFDYSIRGGGKYRYYTNDIINTSFDIKKLIPDKLTIIEPSEEIEVDDDELSIFDFGGYLDSRVVEVSEYVDKVALVVMYQSKAELKLIVRAVNSIKKYNENICVILNNTETNMIQEALETLDVALPDIPIFTINRSKYMHRLANFNQSVYDVAETSNSDKGQLNKTIIPQLNKLFDYLSK